MFQNHKILAIVPARAGSKGILNKNLALLCGRPLLQYTLDSAKNSRYIDEILVSTDGPAIAEFARKWGAYVPFLRPQHLAGDTAKTVEAVFHAVEYLKNNNLCFDSVVLLQATSALRKSQEIDAAIELYYQHRKSVVSVSPVKENPILMRTLSENGVAQPLFKQRSDVRRQDFKQYYIVNGSIYINDFATMAQDVSFNDNEMAFLSDSLPVDIDSPQDLAYAEFCLQKE